MGCFFVGRVAESELIGAGKQRSHPVATGGALIWWMLAALSFFVDVGGAFILIVYNSWNKDEIPP